MLLLSYSPVIQGGLDRAEALITLGALKMLYSEFCRVAYDERDDSPLAALKSAMVTMEVREFHLGQLFGREDDPEYLDDGSVNLIWLVQELAVQRLGVIRSILDKRFPDPIDRLAFFVGSESEADSCAKLDPAYALHWVSSGCPIE